ncbi:acetyl-CoA hydrolase/transferase family protein [Papillibacter cinnamivorans]|uniref:4-hydroxybutyrate CoA-transferase n=1 Tax=Papillibacter cinnamivorans DSM 12816 TaxID=1122930 RepID=A0A1W2CAN4_9FIRM|nr:acetyl-CoA hydrolase/transferase C-terminal domain-containing protein [Papillibacter cinnamivorans]SMC81748.1 4-hydroxybutyrate CoA-transferase [Papillibacter cinnamivorans DSM 12816]
MWKEQYNQKKVTAEEAISHIKSGDTVAVGGPGHAPLLLVDTLVKHKDDFRDVTLYQMDPREPIGYLAPGMEGHIHHVTSFCSANNRGAVASGQADFIPCFYMDKPELMRSEIRPDVAFIHVTPPDRDGYCSYGAIVSFIPGLVESAKYVIAEVNDQLPYTYGSSIHVSEIGCLVEVSRPAYTVAPPVIGEAECQIGEICASLIEDGSTLQIGIGAVPEAALKMLRGKRDLGVHTELLGEGLVELMELGVVTNKKKTYNPGKCTATIYLGSQKLYDYLDHNPRFEVLPVNYTNDPRVICRHEKMVSINACIQVDLLGQVNSEGINGKQFSGIGGQVDFIRGAAMSPGGKSILAFNSVTNKGISKIVPTLPPGTAVTTSRTDVDYLVTEYGYARLKGKSIRDRAKALISIAHPDSRAQLTEEFEKIFFKL